MSLSAFVQAAELGAKKEEQKINKNSGSESRAMS